MQRFPEAMGLFKKCVRGLGVALGQEKESGAALRGNYARCFQESDKLLPVELSGMGCDVDEIERETTP
jgi:hypothetical protein